MLQRVRQSARRVVQAYVSRQARDEALERAVAELPERVAERLEQQLFEIHHQMNVRFDHVSEQLAALLERNVEQDDRIKRDLARIERDLSASRELVVEFGAHVSRALRDLRDDDAGR